MRLPSAAEFDKASLSGDSAHVRFELPAVVRAGVEVRPIDDLRVELAWVHEFWSEHDVIQAVPSGISIDGVTGLPPKLAMPNITIPRDFVDSDSFRLGGEYHFVLGGYGLDARAGLAYETSAVPPAYLSLSSLDFPKWITSLGGSLHVGKHWRFDAVFAHVFANSVYVDPNTAADPAHQPAAGQRPARGRERRQLRGERQHHRRGPQLQVLTAPSEQAQHPRAPATRAAGERRARGVDLLPDAAHRVGVAQGAGADRPLAQQLATDARRRHAGGEGAVQPVRRALPVLSHREVLADEVARERLVRLLGPAPE